MYKNVSVCVRTCVCVCLSVIVICNLIQYSSYPVIEDQTNVLVLCVTGYQVPPESPLQAAAVAAVKPTAPQT